LINIDFVTIIPQQLGQQGSEESSPHEQVAAEDEITPERQQEIESAVQDILTDDVAGIAPQKNDNKPQVEGEENNTEETEAPKTGDSGNKRPIYQEMLKNKQIVLVAGKR